MRRYARTWALIIMADTALLIDFGSTFTKAAAVDLNTRRIIGASDSPTTVQTDIREGLDDALKKLCAQTGALDYSLKLACSSAAGGLKMIVCGLVPELTAEAARIACLGAGAKVAGSFAFELTDDDVDEIDRLKPDILLLCGGTDGGNKSCIIHNAEMLSRCKSDFPVLLAGNRNAAAECVRHLEGREIIRCGNVMPALSRLETSEVQAEIRRLFLERIVRARGLDKLRSSVGGVLMPTPAAVLEAMRLLSRGTESTNGIGELIAVDLGGATTDVYSMADGSPDNDSTLQKGLPEPFDKRTVEGDIGMRHSASGVMEAVGVKRLAGLGGLDTSEVPDMVEALSRCADSLPMDENAQRLDFALAAAAVETAVSRHAGTLEQVYTATGPVFLQKGKNLRHVKNVIATGGALIHSDRVAEIAAFALAGASEPMSLRPEKAKLLIDRKYILSAMGLLAQRRPECALQIMKEELS